MEIRQLRYFVGIADAGSICEGARQLNMSQPPLSYQMHMLEEELGTSLFERRSNGIQLTEAGKILYHRAKSIVQMTETASREIEEFSKNNKRILRLGLTPTSGPAIIDRFEKFGKIYPDIRFEIHDGSTFQLLDAINGDVIELSTVRTPANLEHMEKQMITREPMIAVGTEKFFSSREDISVEELVMYPLLIYRRYNDLIRGTITKSGLKADVYCECDDARTALLWAERGLGVALFPQSMKPLCGKLILRSVASEDLITSILFVWKKGKKLSSAAQQFLALENSL